MPCLQGGERLVCTLTLKVKRKEEENVHYSSWTLSSRIGEATTPLKVKKEKTRVLVIL